MTAEIGTESKKIVGEYRIVPDFKRKVNVVELKTLLNPKKVSAHRFVELAGFSSYPNRAKLLFDTFGFAPFKTSEAMRLGTLLEKPVLDHVIGHSGYRTFGYEECKGDCLDNPVFSGLIDAYDPSTNTIWECKTYGWKESLDSYFPQLSLYWLCWGMAHPEEWDTLKANLVTYGTSKGDLSAMKEGKGIDIDAKRIKVYELGDDWKRSVGLHALRALGSLRTLLQRDADGIFRIEVPMGGSVFENWVRQLDSESEKFQIKKVESFS